MPASCDAAGHSPWRTALLGNSRSADLDVQLTYSLDKQQLSHNSEAHLDVQLLRNACGPGQRLGSRAAGAPALAALRIRLGLLLLQRQLSTAAASWPMLICRLGSASMSAAIGQQGLLLLTGDVRSCSAL